MSHGKLNSRQITYWLKTIMGTGTSLATHLLAVAAALLISAVAKIKQMPLTVLC